MQYIIAPSLALRPSRGEKAEGNQKRPGNFKLQAIPCAGWSSPRDGAMIWLPERRPKVRKAVVLTGRNTTLDVPTGAGSTQPMKVRQSRKEGVMYHLPSGAAEIDRSGGRRFQSLSRRPGRRSGCILGWAAWMHGCKLQSSCGVGLHRERPLPPFTGNATQLQAV